MKIRFIKEFAKTDARLLVRNQSLWPLLLVLILSLATTAGCFSDSGQTDENESAEVGLADSTGDGQGDTEIQSESDPNDGIGGFVTFAAQPSALSSILPGLVVTDFVVVSSRRSGRTTMEYLLKLKISNGSSQHYDKVVATLQSVPTHIVILDGVVVVGNIPPHSTILSPDTFLIDIDLAQSTSFDDFVWLIEGDAQAPPPPPQPGPDPSATGIFMSIDDNSIRGEAISDSHKDWIELTRIMEGLRREGVGSTGSTRRRSSFIFDGVQVEKLLDRSSPKLREALLQGNIFTEIKIDVVSECGGKIYTSYAITLSTARIDGLGLFAEQADRPVEAVAINYTRISTLYIPVGRDCRMESPVFSTQDGELLGL